MTASTAPARGNVEQGWGKVADAFRANRPVSAFGYVPNLWSWNIAEPRARNLAAAVVACLG